MTECGECVDIEDLEKTIGFSREKTKSPVGTADPYNVHLFVCTGHSSWSKIFPGGENSNIKAVVTAIKNQKKTLRVNSRVTATDLVRGSSDEREGFVRVIVFPLGNEFVIRENMVEQQVGGMLSYIQAYLDGDETPALIDPPLLLQYSHFVFICCHEQMDKRCGYCGPRLVDVFENKLQSTPEVHFSKV